MRITGMLATVLLVSAIAQAQEVEPIPTEPKHKKNEIGLFVNPFGSNNPNGYEVPFGIQYKRWTTPNLGYRIIAAAGGYDSEYKSTELIKNDTFYQAITSTNMAMIFAGGGLEMQQRFIGKCYLYAAVEMKAGYGSGYTHTSQVKETANVSALERSYTYEQETVSSVNTSLLVLDATPYVGIKFVFKRLILGTELSAVAGGIMQTSYSGSAAYSNSFFDMGQLQQRFYLNYRF